MANHVLAVGGRPADILLYVDGPPDMRAAATQAVNDAGLTLETTDKKEV